METSQPERKIEDFLSSGVFHLTQSMRKLLTSYISDICLKKSVSLSDFLRKNKDLESLLRSPADPVQKGRKFFELVRMIRYPLSGGKDETVAKSLTPQASKASRGVSSLDSRKRLVNPYYYGEGVFDLEEHVLSLIRSCPLDCAYCFLREVYDDPRFKVAPDYERIAAEIRALASRRTGTVYLNAGENADSLILDAEYGLIRRLWDIVRPHPGIFLEFRTKTDKIGGPLKITDHQERIVAAFSLNPEEDRRLFETNTAAIARRIEAAAELGRAGFAVGLRFEPIAYTPDFKDKYRRLFEDLFARLEPRQVHSAALGALRLTRGLARMLKGTHARVLAEEWVLGPDGKWRYCKALRLEVYGRLLEMLSDYLPDESLVLSTEPPDVWEGAGLAFKTMPRVSDGWQARRAGAAPGSSGPAREPAAGCPPL